MDKSKKYIKMCLKAEEIQKNQEAQTGDSYCEWPTYRARLFGCEHNTMQMCSMKWLPRQGQLQRMVAPIKDMFTITLIMQDLYDFYSPSLCWPGDDKTDKECNKEFREHEKREAPRIKMISNIGSMEQLWLCFVMSKKFSKQWIGNDWVKL